MKKLLVLTDFTANASHAEATALHLAIKLGDSILLYHTLPYIPLIPGDSAGPYVTEGMLFEDSKERLMQEADKLREIAVMNPGCEVNVEEKNGEGKLADVIAELTADPAIEMVIMGGRSGGALEHLLSGSDTAAVIRKARKPVLIIPMTADAGIPQKVVFATDFGVADITAVNFLVRLAGSLGFELKIVHVLPRGEVVTEIGAEVAFRKYLAGCRLDYTQVFDKNVRHGLQQYCRENGAGILAMTHLHHDLMSRIFGHSETTEAIAHQELAVLIFPPAFEENQSL